MTADKWGCPDWRDRSAYPASIDDLEDWQWKWEFLRRDSLYRTVWQLYSKSPDTYPGYLRSVNQGMWEMSDLRDPCESLDESPFDAWTKSGPYYMPKDQVIEYYESLPLEDRYESFLTDLTLGALMTNNPEKEVVQYAIFDLTRPLNPQFRRTEEILKKRQDDLRKEAKQKNPDFEPRRPHLTRSARSNWVRHLRVLDARSQEAATREIWEVLKTEEITSRKDCPKQDSEEYENLLDRKVYSRSKNHHVSPTVKGWIANARQSMVNISRTLLTD